MTTELPAVEAKPAKRRRLLLVLALLVLVVGGAVTVRWAVYGRYHVETDDAAVAGDLVTVTPQVAGTVLAIAAENTTTVHAGDPLVRLDPTDLVVARERAEAELSRTLREVRALYAQTASLAADSASAKADLAVATVDRDRARADLVRRQTAGVEGGVMAEELAHADEAVKGAEARVTASARRAEAAVQRERAQAANTAGVDVAHHPRVLAAVAALRQALLNEGRAVVRAPLDGQVARRAVTTGTYVAAGTPLLSIVPLERVWVDADFKEAQLTQVRVGQPVELVSDLYGPSVVFKGRVAGLDAGTGSAFALLPAQNATGNWIKIVQRVPVRVELDPAELTAHPLRVGLSMTATVDVHPGGEAAKVTPPPAAAAGYEADAARADARIAALLAEAAPADAAAHPHPRVRSSRPAPATP